MWQLRKPVPADVQSAFGRSVFTKSLGTSNDREATKAALALLDELEERWAKLRSNGTTNDPPPAARPTNVGEPPSHVRKAIVRAAYEHVVREIDAHHNALHLADPEGHLSGIEQRRLDARKLQREVHRGELQRFELPTAKQLAKHGYHAEYEASWFNMLVRELATAVLDAQEVALRIDEGHLDPKPTTEVVRRAIRNDDPSLPSSTTNFSVLADQFMKQWLAGRSGEKQTNTEQQKRATLRLFGGYFEDRPIGEVRPQHAAGFFDKLRLFDPTWARSPEARRLPWQQLVERYGDRPRGLSDGTMNRHLQVLQEIWAWARKRDHCAGENPFEGFHKKLRPGVNVKPYVAWEDDELRQLLTPGPKRSDLLEVMLVGMFTGMRLDEIASLTWSQLQETKEGGVTIAFFQVEDAKTPAGNRKVPVHQDLRWLLSRKRGKANERLWPTFNEEGAGKKPGNDAGREFSRYKASKGFNDRAKAFHSFRKNVTRMMERAGVPENDWAQIFGHERGFTYRVYNPDGINMRRRAEIIGLIRYDGLQIPHPLS
jgi:integrase